MSEKELASLGEAEAEILRIVWELGEGTVQEIWGKLPPERDIAQGTVQTVLRRLREKGYVKHHAAGKAHVYAPAMKPERVISEKVRDLINRFFGGDAVPLVMHLAKDRKIDQEDLERLQDLLKSRKKSK
jgi:BlaI family transcriptional regulator, penicillinase repressor